MFIIVKPRNNPLSINSRMDKLWGIWNMKLLKWVNSRNTHEHGCFLKDNFEEKSKSLIGFMITHI